LDDLSEMLLIKGITPAMYYGSGTMGAQQNTRRSAFGLNRGNEAFYTNALINLFTPLSAGKVNGNTASAEGLELGQGLEYEGGQGFKSCRPGPDHTDGTKDDTPFPNLGALPGFPGISRAGPQTAARPLSVPARPSRSPSPSRSTATPAKWWVSFTAPAPRT